MGFLRFKAYLHNLKRSDLECDDYLGRQFCNVDSWKLSLFDREAAVLFHPKMH